jgi:hypothetical protein
LLGDVIEDFRTADSLRFPYRSRVVVADGFRVESAYMLAGSKDSRRDGWTEDRPVESDLDTGSDILVLAVRFSGEVTGV